MKLLKERKFLSVNKKKLNKTNHKKEKKKKLFVN